MPTPPRGADGRFRVYGLKALQRWIHRSSIYYRKIALEDQMEEAVSVLVDGIQDQLRKGPKDVAATGPRLEDYPFPPNPTDHLRIRTGRLIGSVDGEVRRHSWGVAGLAGPQRVKYAAIHEYGGTTGRGGRVRIRPRPYLVPALHETANDVFNILERSVDVFLR